MITTLNHRPTWTIDRLLDQYRSQSVRVAATAFSPVRSDGVRLWTPVRNFLLPDNTAAAGLPVFFEGCLLHHERHIGLVSVVLGTPNDSYRSAEGVVLFRGSTAVVVRGPALVRMAYPFVVERLPQDSDNYWRDLRHVHAQLEMPLAT